MIKMIAVDMDGTFLDGQGSYDHERFDRLYAELNRQGIRFVVATGNHMNRLKLLFPDRWQEMIFVSENGAKVIESKRVLAHHQFNQALLPAFLAYFSDHLVAYGTILTGEKAAYVLKGTVFDFSAYGIAPEQLQRFLESLTWVDSFDALDDVIVKINLHLPIDQCEAVMAAFNEAFKGQLVAVTSGYGAVDILPHGIHKAWGLSQLLAHYGIAPDEVMAFGDGENDLEMLRLTPHSYAMANAPDSVKQVAKHLAPANTENGVMQVIESHLEKMADEHDFSGEL